MSRFTDAELYLRGSETLLASWEEYACGAAGAAVKRFPGVAAAVFPAEPEGAVYNNALLQHDLGTDERSEALDAMETDRNGRSNAGTQQQRPTYERGSRRHGGHHAPDVRQVVHGDRRR